MVEPEVEGNGTFVGAAITVTEFVDAPVELNERGLRSTSASRATSSVTNAPHAAASQYSYHNSLTYVGTVEQHGKSQSCDVGTVEQKHGNSKSSDVVRFDTSAVVGSEVRASTIVGSEVRATAIVGSVANAIVGTAESKANVGHSAIMTDSKTKSSIMR